jgi:hypothetical protein
MIHSLRPYTSYDAANNEFLTLEYYGKSLAEISYLETFPQKFFRTVIYLHHDPYPPLIHKISKVKDVRNRFVVLSNPY